MLNVSGTLRILVLTWVESVRDEAGGLGRGRGGIVYVAVSAAIGRFRQRNSQDRILAALFEEAKTSIKV